MPDGTELRGLFWESAAPAGLVVIRTPYDARQHAATARSWTLRGYHCLVQDVRGRYASDGAWVPYEHEEDDGGAVLRHLHQAHPGVPIVLYGASYAAHTALEAARAEPESVTALVVAVPALGLAETAYDHEGRAQLRNRIGWWHEHGRTRLAQHPLPDAELARRTAEAETSGVVEAATRWGWSPRVLTQWRRLWAAPPIDVAARYDIDVPLLVISGQHDFFDGHARRLARTWPGASHVATGPWGHHLAGDITDPRLRQLLRTAGGVGGVIEAWLAAHGLPGTAAPWTEILSHTHRTRSAFDPATGTWRHEGTAP
ncbi:hypothetical protein BJF85_15470 [Saccharomonospora sp. CUA-673]|uniref:CocE/NonD family hydrolase n=1 Tax=Saccharomonospora sp. CUA-673 TaxID=1904969 RepID=UPI00096019B2|nr:CocE/NonD family hydrolase [Saccharomonospora sp. CUA-673]OLT47571.1 hypothetical protein BJF85_15470 [Saccharomonospora sp. CUA-673]